MQRRETRGKPMHCKSNTSKNWANWVSHYKSLWLSGKRNPRLLHMTFISQFKWALTFTSTHSGGGGGTWQELALFRNSSKCWVVERVWLTLEQAQLSGRWQQKLGVKYRKHLKRESVNANHWCKHKYNHFCAWHCILKWLHHFGYISATYSNIDKILGNTTLCRN